MATLLVLLFVAAFGASGVATWAVLSEPVDAGIEARLDREARILVRLYGQRPIGEATREIRTREQRA